MEIQYKTAKLAKEKDINIYSQFFYSKPNSKMFGVDERGRNYPIKNIPKKLYECGEHVVLNIKNAYYAPTQSELQTWLREKYDIVVWVHPKSHHYFEYQIITNDNHVISSERSHNWEEIFELGLFAALSLI